MNHRRMSETSRNESTCHNNSFSDQPFCIRSAAYRETVGFYSFNNVKKSKYFLK